MSIKTYQEGEYSRPIITSASLSGADLSALRKLRSYERDTVPPCLTVVRENGTIWAFKSVVGDKPPKRPQNGADIFQADMPTQGGDLPQGIDALATPNTNGSEPKPWSRQTILAGKPKGPGRFSHRNIGR